MDKAVTEAAVAVRHAAAALGYAAGQVGARAGQSGRLVAGQLVWLVDAVVGSRLIDAVAQSRLVDRIVDVQLTRILATLEQQPDRVRTLVRGQRESIVDELVERLRSGAVAGDERVDRLVDRLARRDGSG